MAVGAAPAAAPVRTEPPAFAPMARYVTLAVELLNAARAELDDAARPVAGDPSFELALVAHLRPLPESEREPAIRHGVATIAAAVRAGVEPIGSLRPGELAGPRSWAKWQAATVEQFRAARGRDGPGARASPRPKRGLSALLDDDAPEP